MQTIYINTRLPQVTRVCKATPVSRITTRNMSLFPRLVASEFAPMFRLMDDYVSHVATRNNGLGASIAQSLRTFQPRFDVKETKESYELHGELPGIAQQDINIEFTDAQTLSIKGRTESRREEGTRPSSTAAPAAVESQPEQAKLPESESTNYHKASVEDESAASGANANADALTPTTTNASEVASVEQPQQQQNDAVRQTPTERSRYWVSERSVGEFARSFSFPSRVDQENVRASLRDGILSVVVPKAQAPVLKRINIE